MDNPLDPLVRALSRLPGLGRRSAERAALALARQPDGLLADLVAVMETTRCTVRCCDACGSITDRNSNPCRLCTDPSRRSVELCVVEDPGDVLAIERCGAFQGRYHVLMGRVSPAQRMGPEDIRIAALVERVGRDSIEEVILALNTDMDGDATAALIAELLQPTGVSVSRLAFGLPVDSGVRYSDPMTLKRALGGRQLY